MTEMIERLRNCTTGQRVRLTTDEDEEWVVYIGDVSYVEPDAYGAGSLRVNIEYDTDVHEVPTDTLPSESGEICAQSPAGRTDFDPPLLDVWRPVMSDEQDGLIVDDEWGIKGAVVDVDILD